MLEKKNCDLESHLKATKKYNDRLTKKVEQINEERTQIKRRLKMFEDEDDPLTEDTLIRVFTKIGRGVTEDYRKECEEMYERMMREEEAALEARLR